MCFREWQLHKCSLRKTFRLSLTLGWCSVIHYSNFKIIWKRNSFWTPAVISKIFTVVHYYYVNGSLHYTHTSTQNQFCFFIFCRSNNENYPHSSLPIKRENSVTRWFVGWLSNPSKRLSQRWWLKGPRVTNNYSDKCVDCCSRGHSIVDILVFLTNVNHKQNCLL